MTATGLAACINQNNNVLDFFVAPNLIASDLAPGAPWDFAPAPEELARVRALPKDQRRAFSLDPRTRWQIYSPIRGVAANQRVSKENPPHSIHGLVADYDATGEINYIEDLINLVPHNFRPNFMERSLGGKWRAVWVFECPLLVPDFDYCTLFIKLIFQKLGVVSMFAGYDPASEKPAEMWTNGGEWYETKSEPLPWDIVLGIACDVSKRTTSARAEIPLTIIAEEVAKRFPGRWQGAFEEGNLGVRFWVDTADCPTGCRIKPDGMQCFTGNQPFVKWHEIFGVDWVTEQRALNLAKAAGEIYFDGKFYWEKNRDLWVPMQRQDVLLGLASRGLSDRVPKGQTLSEAEQVLRHIQTVNRVIGAAPLVTYKPGLVELDGNIILNTNSCRPLVPSARLDVTPADFPWLWDFLNGLFDHGPRSRDIFLAWLQRGYIAVSTYQPLMGQAVFMCGPKENGKTLLGNRVIRPLLGGKVANPYDWLLGKTEFNAELLATSFLAIDDEDAPSEQFKGGYLSKIKAFVANPNQAYRPLFRDRVTIPYTGRLYITLNDDPHAVGGLVEINDNTGDKISFFGTLPYKKQWPDRATTEAIIAQELPLFARWLLDKFKPSPDIVIGGRMGIVSFHDPRILDLSQKQLHAYNLLELLAIWCSSWAEEDVRYWDGSPSKLLTEFNSAPHFDSQRREWNTSKLARALTALARLSGSGVQLLPGKGRQFRLDKQTILKHENHETPSQS